MTLVELDGLDSAKAKPFRSQLLKWVGNKQRFAHEIANHLPPMSGEQTYFEPFLGSGAVLATLRPEQAMASDAFGPLIEIWQALQTDPDSLVAWYASRWDLVTRSTDARAAYEAIKASYNASPNGADLVFLSRSCYGGVVRFRQRDGYMSTPMGPHKPISPESFATRVLEWRSRTEGVRFLRRDYRDAFVDAQAGDVIYCDPPYTHSQTILYGAQSFRLQELMVEIAAAKRRRVRVALSIDGSKTRGDLLPLPIPPDLFEREVLITVGGSMLKRFQLAGETQIDKVADRLLLTY